MSNRERVLAVVVVGLGVLFVLDRLVLAPLTEGMGQMREESVRLESSLADAHVLVRNESLIEQRWLAYQAAGLSDDTAVARIRVQEQLAAWSKSSGLDLDTLATGRVVKRERHNEIGFIVTGTGPMRAVQRFLWSIRGAPFPLRIKQCDIAAREKRDRLSLSLRLSTITAGDLEDTTATARSHKRVQ